MNGFKKSQISANHRVPSSCRDLSLGGQQVMDSN